MRTRMTTTTRPPAASALDLNHRTLSATGARSRPRALRVFLQRKGTFCLPILPSPTNCAVDENEAETRADKKLDCHSSTTVSKHRSIAVPAGEYHAFVRTETKDRWRIELIDVPHRGNVQIHVGNNLEDTIGCVLLGTDLGEDMCTVKNSKAAFDKFKLAFIKESGGAPEKDVEVMVFIRSAD